VAGVRNDLAATVSNGPYFITALTTEYPKIGDTIREAARLGTRGNSAKWLINAPVVKPHNTDKTKVATALCLFILTFLT
jgi:hypothetical protein